MNVYSKARWLASTGRVKGLGDDTKPNGEPFSAFEVVGEHDTYRVEKDMFGIRCDCPARRRCSHEIAVWAWLEFDPKDRERLRAEIPDDPPAVG